MYIATMNVPIVSKSYLIISYMISFSILDVILAASPVLTSLTTSIYTNVGRWGWWKGHLGQTA